MQFRKSVFAQFERQEGEQQREGGVERTCPSNPSCPARRSSGAALLEFSANHSPHSKSSTTSNTHHTSIVYSCSPHSHEFNRRLLCQNAAISEAVAAVGEEDAAIAEDEGAVSEEGAVEGIKPAAVVVLLPPRSARRRISST